MKVAYITRDIERALGKKPYIEEGYFIISNFSENAKEYVDNEAVCLVREETLFDTHELIEREETVAFLKRHSITQVAVFKQTEHIERLCEKYGLTLLNPSAKLASTIENKISQFEWLGDLQKYLPPTTICIGKELHTQHFSAIVQYNRTHTGEGTQLIETKKQADDIASKFPDRELRISKFILGPVFTVNAVVNDDGVLVGNISYQITGLAPYTDNRFATIGNDWGVKEIGNWKSEIWDLALKVGGKMKDDGWKGLFGIDVVVNEDDGKVYLIEINARQPASTTYESQLQQRAKSKEQRTITIFEAHLSALLGESLEDQSLIEITDGAQLFDRKKDVFQKFDHSVMESNYQLNTSYVLRHTSKTLSENTLNLLKEYKHIKLGNHSIPTPYFNNKRSGARASLRVLFGKGRPEEIEEEARLLATKKKVDLDSLDESGARKLLVDNNLGIDCSGFVYHLLSEELESLRGKKLKNTLKFPNKNLIRKFLSKLRPAENTNVAVLADNANSFEIPLSDVKPGDLITMKDASSQYARDHVLLVTQTSPLVGGNEGGSSQKEPQSKVVEYSHSFRWSTDGQYHHGVRSGRIEIVNIEKTLAEQRWIEDKKEGDENETFQLFRKSKAKSIRRLHALN